mmetsp:Transcript_50349/g.151626  ORF Transcript_50349/g.151626 Transcript_50349/m.151626 type:complete len:135 (+) Transcript_50349:4519-4923(+)
MDNCGGLHDGFALHNHCWPHLARATPALDLHIPTSATCALCMFGCDLGVVKWQCQFMPLFVTVNYPNHSLTVISPPRSALTLVPPPFHHMSQVFCKKVVAIVVLRRSIGHMDGNWWATLMQERRWLNALALITC